MKAEHGKNSAAVVVGHEIYCFAADVSMTTGDHLDVQVFNTVSLRWLKLTSVTPGRGENLEVPS